MPSPFVVHCKRAPYDVYAGRPSLLGNPWSVKPSPQTFLVESHEEAVQFHSDWIDGIRFTDTLQDQRLIVLRMLRTLEGKVFGCWCAPKRCHCDKLAEIANMKIKEISYNKTYPFQMTRFEIVKIDIGSVATVEPGENPEEAMAKLKEFVETQLVAELEILERVKENG